MKRDDAKIAGMSDEAVSEKTGCTWDGWVKRLDRARACTMTHQEIARHLQDEHDLPGWWSSGARPKPRP